MRPDIATAARPNSPARSASSPPPSANRQRRPSPAAAAPRAEPRILFQKFFKSVGPRTYAAQVKEAGNGNHFLVLTEGRRDPGSDDVRKTRLFIFSEDFPEFFRMLHETAQFIKANPLPDEVRERRRRFWAKKNAAGDAAK